MRFIIGILKIPFSFARAIKARSLYKHLKSEFGVRGTENLFDYLDYGDSLYSPYHARMRAFRKWQLKNNYRVKFEVAAPRYLGDTKEDVLMGVSITVRTWYGRIVEQATAWAHENKKASEMNETSFTEIAETSAAARCLGHLGFGIEENFASSNEVGAAINRGNVHKANKKSIDEGISGMSEELIQKVRSVKLGQKTVIQMGEKCDWDYKVMSETVDKLIEEASRNSAATADGQEEVKNAS